jgi:hypothetical protein
MGWAVVGAAESAKKAGLDNTSFAPSSFSFPQWLSTPA